MFGLIPIIEYPANSARLGCFEIVLSLLDAINDFDCARTEAVQQFVQSLLVLYNCQVDEGTTAEDIRAAGMILLKSVDGNKADVKNLADQLDQSQNQTLKDDLYNSVLQIVGVPSQSSSGTSDSSNNGAVVLKNGWQGAETRATEFEAMFKLPEMEMLYVVNAICSARKSGRYTFNPETVEIKFTRRNYEDILSKSQTLVTMLGNEKIHPQKAYEASGLFVDTEEAYQMGMEWYGDHGGEEQPVRAVTVDAE
jgi:SPP1 family phage portal protein